MIKKYPKYKDSGIVWLGEIPEHWEIKKLKYVITIKNGESISTNDMQDDGKFEVYGGNGVLGFTENFNVSGDNIIIGRVGAKCGNVHLTNGHKWVSDNAMIVKTNQNYWFLFFVLISMNLNNLANQNAQPLITGSMVKSQSTIIPPKDEQEIIAVKTELNVKKVDKIIEKKQKLIELLKEIRTATITYAVTKGLDPNVKMKDSVIEWLGEIPEHWDIRPLGIDAKMLVPQRNKPKKFDGIIPWIRIEDLDGKYISDSKSERRVSEKTIREMNLRVYPVGTVLCSCSCNMGITSIVAKPLVSNQTFIGIVPGSRLMSGYLYYLMQTCQQHLTALAVGAIQQYLSRDDFKHICIPVPNNVEQKAIVTFLDREINKIDTLVKKTEFFNELLKEYRQSLIFEFVTGKIDVRNGRES